MLGPRRLPLGGDINPFRGASASKIFGNLTGVNNAFIIIEFQNNAGYQRHKPHDGARPERIVAAAG